MQGKKQVKSSRGSEESALDPLDDVLLSERAKNRRKTSISKDL
jgi:hypothetical protein